MIATQHHYRDLSMRRLNYYGMILLTTPFILIGVFVALFELVVGGDGTNAEFIAKPFLWAYRRKV